MQIGKQIWNQFEIDFPLEHDISFVYGENGSGKTLTLRALAEYLCEQGDPVIYLPDDRRFALEDGDIMRVYYKEKMSNPSNLFDKYGINLELMDFKTQYGRPIFSGFMQLVNLFAQAYLAPKGTTLIIDEPERNLHISFQQTLIEDLMTIPSIGKIVMATHAPSIPNAQTTWVPIKECLKTIEAAV